MGILKHLFGGSKNTNQSNPLSDYGLNIGSNLTLDQKWAIVCFEFSLASFANGDRERREAQKLIDQEARMLNVNPHELTDYVNKFSNPHVILPVLKSINDSNLLDQIAYTCFGIAHLCNNKDAVSYYAYTFEQLGYTEEKLIELVKKVELMGKMFGGIN